MAVGYDAEVSKNIEGSYLIIDGVIEKSIEELVQEQEKHAKAKKTQGGKAALWLVGYLAGKGEVPSSQVVQDGGKAGLLRGRPLPSTSRTRGG